MLIGNKNHVRSEQSLNNPAHNNSHTLDLILSYGVSVNNVEVLDFNVSKQKAVIFHYLLPLSAGGPPTCRLTFSIF